MKKRPHSEAFFSFFIPITWENALLNRTAPSPPKTQQAQTQQRYGRRLRHLNSTQLGPDEHFFIATIERVIRITYLILSSWNRRKSPASLSELWPATKPVVNMQRVVGKKSTPIDNACDKRVQFRQHDGIRRPAPA